MVEHLRLLVMILAGPLTAAEVVTPTRRSAIAALSQAHSLGGAAVRRERALHSRAISLWRQVNSLTRLSGTITLWLTLTKSNYAREFVRI